MKINREKFILDDDGAIDFNNIENISRLTYFEFIKLFFVDEFKDKINVIKNTWNTDKHLVYQSNFIGIGLGLIIFFPMLILILFALFIIVPMKFLIRAHFEIKDAKNQVEITNKLMEGRT